MSALFNFHSFLTVLLLFICTCTFVKIQFPAILRHKTGFQGFFWKAARIGERLSPWVAAGCFAMGYAMITEASSDFKLKWFQLLVCALFGVLGISFIISTAGEKISA